MKFGKNSQPVQSEIIPAGRYKVVIDQAEMRVGRTGDNYLYLRMKLQEGAFKGRTVGTSIVFKSDTWWRQKKGRTSWLKLLTATQMVACPDESHLIDKVLDVSLVNKEGRDGLIHANVEDYLPPRSALEVVEDAKAKGEDGSASSW